MSGNDITQLAALLIMHNYLSKREMGYDIYSKPVRQAVIAFQKDAGLPATGVCDSATIKKLQDWEKIQAKKKEDARIAGYEEGSQRSLPPATQQPAVKKYQLGDRTLKIGCSGQDVDKLVSLLKEFKFLSPEPQISFYDLAVYEAVKKAQTKFKIEPTGEADYSTISALKDLKGE